MEKNLKKIRENLEAVQDLICNATAKVHRKPEEITLVGVTKYVDSETARVLFEAGCHELAESRPQQLWQKGADLHDLDVRWHMIGHLQRNKAQRTLEFASVIHSIDSVRILDQIDKDAKASGRNVQLLIEVNATEDQAKTGLSLDDARSLLAQHTEKNSTSCVAIVGVMGMSSVDGDESKIRREFSTLRECRDRWSLEFGLSLPHLSMGMSDDFPIAIEEGSTMIRIGSRLFAGVLAEA